MIQSNLVKKAYKLSHENTEDVQVNRDNIEKLKIQISNIHTHSHSNKSVLDQTTASFLTSEKQKLSTITSGANKNVQANWQETDSAQDSFIQNKQSNHRHYMCELYIQKSVQMYTVKKEEDPSQVHSQKGDPDRYDQVSHWIPSW